MGTVEITASELNFLADSMGSDDVLTIDIVNSSPSSNFSILSNDVVIAAVDVSLYINNTKLSSGFGTLTITIPVGIRYAGQTLTVLHLKDDGSYERLSATVDSEGNLSFDVTSLSSFAVISEEDVPVQYYFDDVASDAWYVDAVQYVYDEGLMSGTGDHRFSPDTTTSLAPVGSTVRSEAATILMRFLENRAT